METLPGRVRRLEITRREVPCFGGREFGETGPYEYLEGRAFCELNPTHPLNSGIVYLDQAPRNAAGWVDYAVDICLLKPVDPARGNGWVFHEVLNRGNKRGVHRINDARPSNSPSAPEDAGTGFLMRHGFTIAWVAWQGDTLPGGGRMEASLPVARKANGAPIIGCCTDEIIADAPGSVRDEAIKQTSPTMFEAVLSYPAASLDRQEATLTVRQNERDERVSPPGMTWRYLDEVTRAPGLDRGAIYEFIFPACDPVVLGVGFAAIRDVVHFLRSERGPANPLSGQVRYA